MNYFSKPDQVADGLVVTLEYTLRVDGEILDTSQDNEPIQFIQGEEHIVSGLERELYGMIVGDEKEVLVSPGDGYGEIESDAWMDVPLDEFPPEIPMEIGTQLRLRGEEDETRHARIATIGKETVRLDFNHPLAGKDLHFSVKVVDLRSATEEEKAHGHVHGDGSH